MRGKTIKKIKMLKLIGKLIAKHGRDSRGAGRLESASPAETWWGGGVGGVVALFSKVGKQWRISSDQFGHDSQRQIGMSDYSRKNSRKKKRNKTPLDLIKCFPPALSWESQFFVSACQ